MKQMVFFRSLIIAVILANGLALHAESIRVMSYNVRQGVAKDGPNSWQFRKEASPAMIYDIRPEIFGVQEAFRFQLDYISSQCPAYVNIGIGRDRGDDKGEHMSIFYNSDSLKVIKWGTYWLSETPDVPSKGWDARCYRTATWGLFERISTGTRFFFVNTHLDHRGFEARRKGLAIVYERIKEMNPDHLPMVLTGDFNVLPGNDCLKDINTLMKPARFTAVDADSRGSFNGWGRYGESSAAPTLDGEVKKELSPIDYIYYSGFAACPTFRVVTRKYAGKAYISDHYPIWADLEF